MTSGTQKTTTLTGDRATAVPTVEPLAGLRLCRWPPVAAVFGAQDTVAHASVRVLASHSLLGAGAYAVPGNAGSPDGAGSQTYPRNSWTTVGTHRVRPSAGSVLELGGWYVPAGQTQRNDGGTWNGDGVGARVRVTVTWTGDGGTDGRTYSRTMDASPLENGDAPQPALGHVRQLDPVTMIAPTLFGFSPDIVERYSEWPQVDIVIETSGAPRIGDLVLVEKFLAHVDDVTDGEGSTLHGFEIGGEVPQQSQTPGPQTDAAGANEPRFGTERLLDVAERQRERVGPHILSWSAWQPDAAAVVAGTEQVLEFSGTTLVDIFDNTLTSWDADNPGWLVEGGAYAADWALSSPEFSVSGRSLVPVRVEVYAAVLGSADLGGIVRLQSGARDFVDVFIPSDGSDRHVQFGWLEVQREGDSMSALLQAFARVNDVDDTLRLGSIDVSFGHF
ncbi:MAG: hypothetical protein ACRBN8_22395 [Nannocystales bacterium]